MFERNFFGSPIYFYSYNFTLTELSLFFSLFLSNPGGRAFDKISARFVPGSAASLETPNSSEKRIFRTSNLNKHYFNSRSTWANAQKTPLGQYPDCCTSLHLVLLYISGWNCCSVLVWQYGHKSPASQLLGSPHSSPCFTLGQGVDLQQKNISLFNLY